MRRWLIFVSVAIISVALGFGWGSLPFGFGAIPAMAMFFIVVPLSLGFVLRDWRGVIGSVLGNISVVAGFALQAYTFNKEIGRPWDIGDTTIFGFFTLVASGFGLLSLLPTMRNREEERRGFDVLPERNDQPKIRTVNPRNMPPSPP
jgi:hypothetical protein